MKRAIEGLKPAPDFILIDGNQLIPRLKIPQKTVIKGDSRVYSIAAASVVAKVLRDEMMERLDEQYPGYGFARHKGYGTKDHVEALCRMGPCPVHRRSFAPVRAVENPTEQMSLL
jgi:ribonuclease HII